MGSIVFREVQITSNGNRGEPCHNSRTKLHMKLLHVQKRDNIEFYLCCKFQRLPFSVRHKTDVTDGVTNKQTNKRTNYRMPRGSAPRHNAIVIVRVKRNGRGSIPYPRACSSWCSAVEGWSWKSNWNNWIKNTKKVYVIVVSRRCLVSIYHAYLFR